MNNTNNPFVFNDICRTLHPTVAEYVFFASTHGTLAKKLVWVGHKADVNKFQNNGNLQNMLYFLTTYNQTKIK